MQQENKVAKRYAKSLISLAIEKNCLDAVYSDMAMLSELASSSREFSSLLKSPIVKKKTKTTVLEKLFAGKINNITEKFIAVLTRKNRESDLVAVATSFVIAYHNYKNITEAVVTTAVPIDDSLRLKVNELVKKLSTEEVDVKEKVDPSIIGGFVLQVGDKQVDASVLKSLSSMKNKFRKNLYKRKF